MKKVAIVVLNWNQPKLTIDTVESLLKIKHSSFEYQILLVDNGSKDDSLQQLQNLYSTNSLITIFETNQNLGYVGGNNFGIVFALKNNFDSVLLLNNDVIVDSNFLEELVKKSDKYDLLGPKIYFAKGFEFHKDRYSKQELGNVIWSAGGKMDWNNILGSNIGVDEVDKGQHNKIKTSVDFLTGCALLVNKSVFQKIGLLNRKFFMYLEDVDFCHRAKLKGFKMAYIPTSKIWHVNSGSSKSGSLLQDYFITRNRLLFGTKYASLRTKFALIRESIRFLNSSQSTSWRKQAVKDFYLHKFGKGSWK